MSERPRIYSKPALGESQLLARWQSRGLVLPDEDRALRYLRYIGYYRLSAYVRSFEGTERDVLRPGTTFDEVLRLYVFDRKLRLLVLDAIERVEVALRSSTSDHLARIDGPHWYENRGTSRVEPPVPSCLQTSMRWCVTSEAGHRRTGSVATGSPQRSITMLRTSTNLPAHPRGSCSKS